MQSSESQEMARVPWLESDAGGSISGNITSKYIAVGERHARAYPGLWICSSTSLVKKEICCPSKIFYSNLLTHRYTYRIL